MVSKYLIYRDTDDQPGETAKDGKDESPTPDPYAKQSDDDDGNGLIFIY